MALPPINSGDGVSASAWWQQFAASGAVGAVTGLFTALWGMAGMRSRISVLEANEAAATQFRTKLEDAFTAMADAHRVQWEKTQTQIWQLRTEMAQLVTTNQLHSTRDEIISVFRHRHEGE